MIYDSTSPQYHFLTIKFGTVPVQKSVKIQFFFLTRVGNLQGLTLNLVNLLRRNGIYSNSLDDMDLFAVVECNKNNEPSQILVFMHQFQNLTNKLFF